MKLKLIPQTIHISHLYHLVSAYQLNKENVERLVDDINKAVITAKEETKGQIVDHDCMDHIFVVHPSGRVSLYCEMGRYEIVRDDK